MRDGVHLNGTGNVKAVLHARDLQLQNLQVFAFESDGVGRTCKPRGEKEQKNERGEPGGGGGQTDPGLLSSCNYFGRPGMHAGIIQLWGKNARA